jgi:glycosyltransferase involved in cell wall biosynthesis
MYPDHDKHCHHFHLEAVTVCVGYADFLAVTLPQNLPIFDRFVVVTTPEDIETRDVCRRYGVQTVCTREFYRNGDAFNKGAGINRGLDQLSHSGWVVHLDSDILLPAMTRQAIRSADLCTDSIYGADRAMIKNRRDYERFLRSGWLCHDFHYRVNFPKGFDVGTRWVSEHQHFVPIGFFQAWFGPASHYHGTRFRRYPTAHSTAARTDVQFALQWDRHHRHILPSVIAVHLESEAAGLGANWRGRKTKRFGPANA